METETNITEAQRKMLTRLADLGGFVAGDDIRRDDRDPNRQTWTLPTKFALIDKGLVRMTNRMGTLHMTRAGYAAIGRPDEF